MNIKYKIQFLILCLSYIIILSEANNIGDILVKFSCNNQKTIDNITGAGTCYIIKHDVNSISDAFYACHQFVGPSSWVGNIANAQLNNNICDMGKKYTNFVGIFLGAKNKNNLQYNQQWEWIDGKIANQSICQSSYYTLPNGFDTKGIIGFGLYMNLAYCDWRKSTQTVKSVLCMTSEIYNSDYPNGTIIDRTKTSDINTIIIATLVPISFVLLFGIIYYCLKNKNGDNKKNTLKNMINNKDSKNTFINQLNEWENKFKKNLLKYAKEHKEFLTNVLNSNIGKNKSTIQFYMSQYSKFHSVPQFNTLSI